MERNFINFKNYEKITIHRSSFVQALQKHESGVATGVKPRNGDRTRHLLQMESQILGVGCVQCAETQNPGRGAFSPQKDVR